MPTFIPMTLRSIQALRGAAVLLVVLFHASAVFGLPKYFATDPLGGAAAFGYAGVDAVFSLFILSRHFGTVASPCIAGAAWTHHRDRLGAFAASPLSLEFLLGLGTYQLLRTGRFVRLARAGLPAGVLLFGLAAVVDSNLRHLGGTWGELIYAAAGSLIVWGSVACEASSGTARRPGVLTSAGNASYSIYLVHFPAISMACKTMLSLQHHLRLPLPFVYTAVVLIAVGAGAIFYRAVERPLMRSRDINDQSDSCCYQRAVK